MHLSQNERCSSRRSFQELVWLEPEAPLGGRADLLDPVMVLLLLLPLLVSLQKQSFHLFFRVTCCQLTISPARGKGSGGFVVGMRAVSTHDTAERLLRRAVGAIHKVAAGALLRGGSSSKETVSHQLPRRLCKTTEVFSVRSLRAFW
jgi:hypothetical protein